MSGSEGATRCQGRGHGELELRLPEPLVDVPVFDLDGNFPGAPDLLDVEAGLALEFDGAGHRERHRTDKVREEGLERHGLVVGRADSLDLTRHRPELGRRILAGRRDGLGRTSPLGGGPSRLRRGGAGCPRDL